jgi:hypothetical protein
LSFSKKPMFLARIWTDSDCLLGWEPPEST